MRHIITILVLFFVWHSGFSQDCPPPAAGFSVTENCLVAGDSVHFVSASTVNTAYLYDFGDGTTSTDANPVHIFNDYGYYVVTLTVTNFCGTTAQSTQILYVNPSDCPCDTNLVFDYPDDSYMTDTNAPAPFSTVTIEGDVFIPAGTNINLNSVTLRFAPKGRLIIMPGATLNASYTTFTALCPGTMWQGIEVWGYQGVSANDPSQGYLVLGEQNKVEFAHIGVLIGQRNMAYLYDTTTNKYVTGGGRVYVSETTFKDDGTGIYFTERVPATINNPVHEIHHNLFTASHISHPLPDGHYLCLTANAYPHNPYYPWGQPATPRQRTHAGIYMEGQHELMTMYENKFTNVDYGIESYDSHFNITRSGFTNLYHGIYIYNALTSIYNNHKIFENNNLGVGYYFDSIPGNDHFLGEGILIWGGQYDEIKDN